MNEQRKSGNERQMPKNNTRKRTTGDRNRKNSGGSERGSERDREIENDEVEE